MNTDILQAIATGLVTILGFFMFYDSKKRTEAANASQEEAKAKRVASNVMAELSNQ